VDLAICFGEWETIPVLCIRTMCNLECPFFIIVIIIDIVGTKKIFNQEFYVENEDFLPGTGFPQTTSEMP